MKTDPKITDSKTTVDKRLFLLPLIFLTPEHSDDLPKYIDELHPVSCYVKPALGSPSATRVGSSESSASSTRLGNSERYSLEGLKMNKLKLSHLSKLEPNWNGYDGLPIDQKVVDQALELLSMLEYQPKIFPTGRGTIQIEYFRDDQNQIEFELFLDNAFMVKVENGSEVEEELGYEEIPDIVSSFYS